MDLDVKTDHSLRNGETEALPTKNTQNMLSRITG